jgi:stearoyl-CoA desaturase (Delta-9 desaturase)
MERARQVNREAIGSDERAWPAIAYLLLSPVLAVGSAAAYARANGIHAADIAGLALFYSLTLLGITAGYHRYYAHRTYECHRAVQALYLVLGAIAMQNTVAFWASNHRYHHQYEDGDGDPYNIRQGFFHAHMGWMFAKELPDRPLANVPDLKRDALVRWQERWYWPMVIGLGLGLPAAFGALFDRPLGGLIWGGLLRIVVSQHVTFMINSVAHSFGRRAWSVESTARDSHWLAAISMGEGYHSFHHAHPSDYRTGWRWYHLDPGKWWIAGLERLGLAWRVRRSAVASRERAWL